eukprot:15436047-Alexandrium_andersonii.AAC.1
MRKPARGGADPTRQPRTPAYKVSRPRGIAGRGPPVQTQIVGGSSLDPAHLASLHCQALTVQSAIHPRPIS